MTQSNPSWRASAPSALLLALAACGEPAVFSEERTLPAENRPTVFGQSHRERFGLRAPAAPAPGAGTWTAGVPSHWQVAPPARFRDLRWFVDGDSLAECAFTAQVGGGLRENVSRWYSQQFGLPVPSEQELAARPTFPLLGDQALLLEIEGTFRGRPGTKMLLLVRHRGGQLRSTFRLTAKKEIADRERDAFLAAAATVRPGGGGTGGGTGSGSGNGTGSGTDRGAAQPAPGQSAGDGFPPVYAATAPEHWGDAPPGQFRDIRWFVDGDPTAECYLTAQVGGGVRENVARWAGQFGLPAPGDAEFAALPTFPLFGDPATLLELEGTFRGRADTKMLLLVRHARGQLQSTFRMTAPKAIAERERDSFLAVAASVREVPGGGAGPAGTDQGTGPGTAGPGTAGPGTADPATTDPGAAGQGAIGQGHGAAGPAPFEAAIPGGWTPMGDTGSRLLRHRLPGGGEVYLGSLSGGLEMMLGIWYGELGQDPPGAAAIAALAKVPMLGGQAVLVDLRGAHRGMDGSSIPDARLLVAVLEQGGGVTFAKCVGPAEAVQAQRAAFLELCATVKRTDR